jgi:hypothetical protein
MAYVRKADTINATITGDASVSADEIITFNTVNSNVGMFGNSSNIPIITVNEKGLITGVTTTQINSVISTITTVTTASVLLTSSTANTYVGVNYNGKVTLTLPETPTNGTTFTICDESDFASINTITIFASGSNTINKNYTSVTIKVNGASITLMFRGTNWFLI